jgi:hypothetical protein
MKKNEQQVNIKYLSNLSAGEAGEIIQVRGKPETHRYLHSQGLMMGRSIFVNSAENTPQDQMFTIQAGDMIAVIDRATAGNIKVLVV